jgi:tetratricopeptide (TPR) repeat protein
MMNDEQIRSTTAREDPAIADNTIGGGTFYGPVLQGRDIKATFMLPAVSDLKPAFLPRDIPVFVGRAPELRKLRENAKTGGTIMVTAIDGAAGVGKTALAVHAAHKLISEFPDGQLYADLHGFTQDQTPLTPAEVLTILLSGFGLPNDDIPARLDGKAAKFRQLTAERKIIILLDNVANEQQVIPLLPGTGSSLVIITSRNMLAGLEVNDRISLDVLPATQAHALLARLMRRSPTKTDKTAITKIAHRCGYLPLALRICGHLLATHRSWTADYLAKQLEQEHDRLDRLDLGPSRQVRAAYEVSYRQLPELDARVFRLLGLHPGIDFDTGATSSLAEVDSSKASRILERLASAHLVEEKTAGRYQMHDLIRLFAIEATNREDDSETQRQAIVKDMLYYLFVADMLESATAIEKYRSEQNDDIELPQGDALALFESERANFVNIQRYAADHNHHYIAVKLGRKMARPLGMLHYLEDWMKVSEKAVAAARSASFKDDESALLTNLGNIHLELREFDKAIEYFELSLDMHQELGDEQGTGIVLNSLGSVYVQTREFGKAVEYYEQSLAIHRQFESQRNASDTLNNLGALTQQMGQLETAIDYYKQSLALTRETKDRYTEASTLSNIGAAYSEMSQWADALAYLQEALSIDRELGNLAGESGALVNLGSTHSGMKNYRVAIDYFKQALSLARKIGHQHREGVALHGLGRAYMKLKQYSDAISFLRQSVDLSRASHDPEGQAASLQELGRCAWMIGEIDLAKQSFKASARYYTKFDSPQAATLMMIVKLLGEYES